MDLISYDSTELTKRFFGTNPASVGGGIDNTFIKYNPENTFRIPYTSGHRQYKRQALGRAYVAKGGHTWGATGQSVRTLQPNHSAAAGVMRQFDTPSAYLYKVDQNLQFGKVDPHLPRGGSMMRVVATEASEDPRSYNSQYPWATGVVAPAGQPGPAQGPPAGGFGGGGGGGGRYDNPDDGEDTKPNDIVTPPNEPGPSSPNIPPPNTPTDSNVSSNDHQLRLQRILELSRQMQTEHEESINRTAAMMETQIRTILDQLRRIDEYEEVLGQSVEHSLEQSIQIERLQAQRNQLEAQLAAIERRLAEMEDGLSSGWTPSGPPSGNPLTEFPEVPEEDENYITGDSGSFEEDQSGQSGSTLPSYDRLSASSPIYNHVFFNEVLTYFETNFPGLEPLGDTLSMFPYIDMYLPDAERVAWGRLRAGLTDYFYRYIQPRERGVGTSITRSEALTAATLYNQFRDLFYLARLQSQRQDRFINLPGPSSDEL